MSIEEPPPPKFGPKVHTVPSTEGTHAADRGLQAVGPHAAVVLVHSPHDPYEVELGANCDPLAAMAMLEMALLKLRRSLLS